MQRSMVFRFCREPPLRAVAANVEEMHAFLRSLRCAGAVAVLQNVSVPSSTTRARVSERSELPGKFLILRIKIKRFRLRIAYSYEYSTGTITSLDSWQYPGFERRYSARTVPVLVRVLSSKPCTVL